MINYLLNMIYPPKCSFCEVILPITHEFVVCQNCEQSLVQLEKQEAFVVNNNFKNKLDGNISLFSYGELVAFAIKNGKYNNHPNFFIGFGTLMGKYLLENFSKDIDYILPIPIHKKRERERGFNQAEIMAKEISKITGIKFLGDAILRTKNTKPQSMVHSYKARSNNLIDAFKINKKYNLIANNILLIDDIYTTGNTMSACGYTLKSNGADKVFGLCLAMVTKKEEDDDEI